MILFANLVELVAMPALAGLIIVAGIQMINLHSIQTVWQTNAVSRAIMVLTFGSTLVMPLQYAVLLGVALSVLLFVFQQSNTIRVVQWVVSEASWPIEQPAPGQLESNRVTILYIYGNLFYAMASALEKGLQVVDQAQKAVVIFLLRGYEDVGATINEVVRRYTKALQANGGKLILASVSIGLYEQLRRTGMLDLIGRENVFMATPVIGEAGNAALKAANDWSVGNSEPNQSGEAQGMPV